VIDGFIRQYHDKIKTKQDMISSILLTSLGNIACYLEPRELFNFAYTNKELLHELSMSMVVSVAMFNGSDRQRRSIEMIFNQTSVGAIFLPSPIRVLRLINSVRCERCNNNVVLHVRHWGMAACDQCTSCMVQRVVSESPIARQCLIDIDEILRHPRVASVYLGSHGQAHTPAYEQQSGHAERVHHHYMFKEYVSDSSGIKIGPIVVASDLLRLCGSFVDPGDVTVYINNNVRAPSMECYKDFNSIVRTARVKSHAIISTRREACFCQIQAKRQEEVQNATNFIESLTPLLDWPLRLIVGDYILEDVKFLRTGRGYPLFFRYRFANVHILPMLREREDVLGNNEELLRTASFLNNHFNEVGDHDQSDNNWDEEHQQSMYDCLEYVDQTPYPSAADNRERRNLTPRQL
jgi:hypothetical protein